MKNNQILKINEDLNPSIWTDEQLDSEVSEQLIRIANDFFEGLTLEGGEVLDITFTGSLANYNWTKYSDIDLHIIVDFAKIDENYDLVREFFNAKTSLWNKMHNIQIKGFEVELYVQDQSERHHSSGVFSILNNEWIVKPKRVEPKVDTDMVKRKIKSFIDMIERVEDEFDDRKYQKAHEKAINLAQKIKKFRQSGLEDAGEYSNENLAFKYLRNNGFIKTLYDTRNKSYDKMMSIEGDYAKKFNIFISHDNKPASSGFNRLEEEEKFQKRVRKRHARLKRANIGLGNQKNVPPYTKKPNFKRSKSAPAGYGGQ